MKIIKILFYISPSFVKKMLMRMNQKKQMALAKERLKIKVSKDYITELFEQIDIDTDVFVHTSLMHIGKVEGGYKTFVHLLDDIIELKHHTILLSALPFKGSSEEYIKKLKVFDVRKSPVEMGVINEYYDLLPNSKRSLFPTHSVVAVGELASFYTKDHHLSVTPFDKNSPYFKIVEKKGKILMIGADLSHLTLLHLVEDLLGDDFPKRVYTKKTFQVDLINEDGEKSIGKFKTHDGFCGLFRSTKYVTNQLRELPSTKIYPLGCSELIFLDAIEVTICLLEQLKNGCSIYGKVNITETGIEKIEKWIFYFKNL